MPVGAEEAPRTHCVPGLSPPAWVLGGGTGVGAMLSRVPPQPLSPYSCSVPPLSVRPSICLSSELGGGVRVGVKVEGMQVGV